MDCMFCGRPQEECKLLVVSKETDSAICNYCIQIAYDIANDTKERKPQVIRSLDGRLVLLSSSGETKRLTRLERIMLWFGLTDIYKLNHKHTKNDEQVLGI
jgi:ATP-dependent protease Clp ATPase subunit